MEKGMETTGVVLATDPGNLPAVRDLTGGAGRFRSSGQITNPRLSWRVVTRPVHRSAVI
jgi:hypothetical protein